MITEFPNKARSKTSLNRLSKNVSSKVRLHVNQEAAAGSPLEQCKTFGVGVS